jgi:hypothetical protein
MPSRVLGSYAGSGLEGGESGVFALFAPAPHRRNPQENDQTIRGVALHDVTGSITYSEHRCHFVITGRDHER